MPIIGAQTMLNPNRPGHLGGVDSGNINPLYKDQHFGKVERAFRDSSFLHRKLRIRSVRGTDTLTNPRMGIVPLQKMRRGIRAEDHSPTYDQVSIKVDTIILSRANEWTLEDFQSSYDTRMDIAAEQGEEIAAYFDYCGIAQAVKAAQITAVDPSGLKDGGWEGQTPTNIERTAPEGHKGGTCIVFDLAGDEEDPVVSGLKVKKLMTAMRKKEVKDQDMMLGIDWDFYETLSENDKLISTDFVKGNGDYSDFTVHKCGGMELFPNNRMPREVNVQGVSDHLLSHAGNNYAYNNSANDILCVAVIFSTKTLLAGETIPMTTKIFWDDKDKQWYIDAWTAFAITPNRPEVAGALFKFGVA